MSNPANAGLKENRVRWCRPVTTMQLDWVNLAKLQTGPLPDIHITATAFGPGAGPTRVARDLERQARMSRRAFSHPDDVSISCASALSHASRQLRINGSPLMASISSLGKRPFVIQVIDDVIRRYKKL